MQFKKNQINQNKIFLSKISKNDSIQNIKMQIEKELLLNKKTLLE